MCSNIAIENLHNISKMPDEALLQKSLMANVSKENGGKRTRTGEQVNMQEEPKAFVREGPLDPAVVKSWSRVTTLMRIKESSDSAYGNSISYNAWLQARRVKIGILTTVSQEKSLVAAQQKAQKALERVQHEQQRIAEKELKAKAREDKKNAKTSQTQRCKKSGSSASVESGL